MNNFNDAQQQPSNKIYELIQIEIQTVICELTKQQGQDRLKEDISSAVESLKLFNNQLQTELEKLKESSEWKRFTIAFYGETNAGKSTLIEALRIRLGEKTKQKSQQEFKKIQQEFGLTQKAFDNVRRTIMDTESAIEIIDQELAALSRKYVGLVRQAELDVNQAEGRIKQETTELTMQHTKVLQELESEALRINKLIEEVRAELSWWKKIIMRFFKSPEEKQLIEIQGNAVKVKQQQQIERENLLADHQSLKKKVDTALTELQAQKKLEVSQVAKRRKALQEKQQTTEAERKRLDGKAEKLAEFADGQIIGDGRSDYTRENTIYDFKLGEQLFSLIDVPGIEGNEAVVSKSIEDAVRKAHAVFYVTRTARPPQTGEGNTGSTKGTLEKIKMHLGAQSEVWSIYNHPANNPRQLTSPLLNEDEKSSLVAMDAKLKSELKEQYCGSIAISARPAYLALTECVVPGSKEATDQQKYFKRFNSTEAILSLSGLTEFITSLQTTIIGDYRNKILRSNLNKAHKAIEHSLNELIKLQTEFTSLEENIKSEVSNAKSQIGVGLEEFIGSLNASGSKIRRAFSDEVQKHIYDEIEKDISNSQVKSRLEDAIKLKSENIQITLKQSIEDEADVLVEKIKSIIQRSSLHLKKIVTAKNNIFDFQKDFKVNVNVDNGLEVGGLVASGIGAALGIAFLASNPAGWTLAFVGGALALAGSLVGAIKSVWGFFDSDYKKSQQRKETDKVLREANSGIEKEINKIIMQINQEVSVEVEKRQKQLEEPIKQCIDINTSLERANVELIAIARNIKPEVKREKCYE